MLTQAEGGRHTPFFKNYRYGNVRLSTEIVFVCIGSGCNLQRNLRVDNNNVYRLLIKARNKEFSRERAHFSVQSYSHE